MHDCERDNGLPVFLEGDTVIMDNCGFHHSRITERTLTAMLATRGVTLLFQRPYSPNHNFRDVGKVFNRRESSNDRRVFGPKAHCSVPLARYT